MIDTHSHLNLDPLYKNWRQHLADAKNRGVNHIIVLGTDHSSNQAALELAAASPHIFAAIGLHPSLATQIVHQNLDIKKIIDQFHTLTRTKLSHLVAIGECGLDYHWIKDHPKHNQIIALQHQLFTNQIQLAQKLDLPLSIHIRDAHQDTLELLSQFKPRAVLHCFSGDQAILTQALSLGLYISFAGNLTYKNSGHLQSLLQKVPLNRLLLETDAPYLNPDRGRFPNAPAQIKKTYLYTANLLNIGFDKLTQQISQNAHQLFKI